MRPNVALCLMLTGLIGAANAGCAGPMSPFGPIGLNPRKAEEPLLNRPPTTKNLARVRFTPERQVLHGPTTFSVIVEDPDGVPEDFRLLVNFNGLNVTRQFLRTAEVTSLDPLRHEVRFTTKYLRLLPTRENKIKVVYWPKRDGLAVVSSYLPPVCSAYTGNQMLFTVPDFDPPLTVLQLINQHAARKNLNPYFVAALVAQESSFDPRAVSSSKAVGLTQVTSLGEEEIIKKFSDWPRYPGVSEMPLPLLKLGIFSGRIHAGNEWRLDPSLSIQGGVEYLSYLNDYWRRPDKHAQVERKLGPSDTALSEVVLASYNSGAARVSEALESDGGKYLEHEDLAEARKYVRRVVSYCDHFEHQEE